ncbi:MAG: undecaprenyl-diphosphate phosphatase [Minisyncoccia bacterium]
MTFLQAIILGVIEGFTEFLPVSSTAHLLLAQKALGVILTDEVAHFTIAVQLGSILAAAVLYIRYFLSVRKVTELIFVLLPTIIAGVCVYPFLKTLFGNVLLIVPWTLVLGGILMLFGEYMYRQKKNTEIRELTFKEKMILGCAQTLALIPGVSRSAAMVVTGLFSGLPRQAVTSFTFILAVPTMFSATLYDVYKSGVAFSALITPSFIVGLVTAFAVALVSIRFMLFLVGKYTFVPFAWYRIVLGLTIAFLVYL